jgi:hypothetical protein
MLKFLQKIVLRRKKHNSHSNLFKFLIQNIEINFLDFCFSKSKIEQSEIETQKIEVLRKKKHIFMKKVFKTIFLVFFTNTKNVRKIELEAKKKPLNKQFSLFLKVFI